MATSQTEKQWVNIASRLIPLLTALALLLGFAALSHWALTLNPNASKTVSLADFMKKDANDDDTHRVVASVQAVEIAMPASCREGISGKPSLQHQLTQAKGVFDAVDNSLASSNPPKEHETAYNAMETAVEQLSSALSTARSFVDSKKPSELENYSEQWQLGRRQWNTAVMEIWNAANQTPPTVDETAFVGCP
jgi:hypothetical protein